MHLLLLSILNFVAAQSRNDSASTIANYQGYVLLPRLNSELNSLQSAIYDYDTSYLAAQNLASSIATVDGYTVALAEKTNNITTAIADNNSGNFDAYAYADGSLDYYRRYLIFYEVVGQHQEILGKHDNVMSALLLVAQHMIDWYKTIRDLAPDALSSDLNAAVAQLTAEQVAMQQYSAEYGVSNTTYTPVGQNSYPFPAAGDTPLSTYLDSVLADLTEISAGMNQTSTSVVKIMTELDYTHLPNLTTAIGTAQNTQPFEGAIVDQLATAGQSVYQGYLQVVNSMITHQDFIFSDSLILANAIGLHQKFTSLFRLIQTQLSPSFTASYDTMISTMDMFGDMASSIQTSRNPESLDSLPTTGEFKYFTGDGRGLSLQSDGTIGFGDWASALHQEYFKLTSAMGYLYADQTGLINSFRDVPYFGYAQTWTYNGLVGLRIYAKDMDLYECQVEGGSRLYAGQRDDACNRVFVTARF